MLSKYEDEIKVVDALAINESLKFFWMTHLQVRSASQSNLEIFFVSKVGDCFSLSK